MTPLHNLLPIEPCLGPFPGFHRRRCGEASMSRVLLAGDHALVRQRLRQFVEEHCEVIAEATDGREAGRLAEALHPDIAIVDLGSAASTGLDITRRILTAWPSTRVIVLSVHSDEAYIRTTRSTGAAGFVLMDSADVDLVDAIREVPKGGFFVSPALGVASSDLPDELPSTDP